MLARFQGNGPARDSLDCLVEDILLEIMSYLDIVNIIRLRQVSKLYYELTHNGALWKNILRTTNIALPPVPPTSRHTPERMIALEAERILCRALSLQSNWERKYPRCIRAWSFDAFYRVLEMVFLPGGRYLIASVSDGHDQRYALMVYAIDTFGRSRPIVKTDTKTKVYGIRAKYVTIKGQKSIAIAYLRRDYHHKTDKRKAAKGYLPSASQYNTYHTIDPEVKFRHECVVVHARLSVLEALSDISADVGTAQFLEEARTLSPPFEDLVRVTSSPQHPLMCPDIEEIFDSAYLAVAKYPNDIIFKRLEGGPAGTLTCLPVPAYAQWNHTIKAMRLIPQEGAAFVVREVAVPETPLQRCPVYVFEMYTIIPGEPTRITCAHHADRYVASRHLGLLSHVYIADPHVPPRHDESILARLRARCDPMNPPPPPPISVYARRAGQEGTVLARFFPQRFVVGQTLPPNPAANARRRRRRPPPFVAFAYPLTENDLDDRDAMPDERVRVLPGVARPLMVYTPWDDISDAPPILDICPWIDPAAGATGVPDARGVIRPSAADSKHRKAVFMESPWAGLRATTFAWDETIGRLVAAEAGSDELRVYDFAYAPRQDAQGQRLPKPLPAIPKPDAFEQIGAGLLGLGM